MEYFLEYFEEEHVKIILSHVHGENIYLDRSYTITKESIHAMIGFWQIDEVPKLGKILKETMVTLTLTTFDNPTFSVNNIKDPTVRLATMVIGYRIFYSTRMNSVPSAAVHATYIMIVENVDYDLCEAIRSQLMLSLQSIKKDRSQKFKFGQLPIGLFFYFFLPRIGDIQWSNDILITPQIKNNIKAVKNIFSAAMNIYFNDFQKKMSMRLRLPEDVVKQFTKDIYFTITTDFCLMEAIEPREDEMDEMSYEFNYDLLIGYANNLLASPKDKKKKRLGTY